MFLFSHLNHNTALGYSTNYYLIKFITYQVGLILRGMGFSNNTAIYLASGKIYKAEKTMAPLLEMFPLLQTKQTLASAEELAPFKVVFLLSIVFVTEYSRFSFLYFDLGLITLDIACRTILPGWLQ